MGLGQAPTGPDSELSEFSGNTPARGVGGALAQFAFERTLVPLNIPSLWFYMCNNGCGAILPARRMRVRSMSTRYVHGGRGPHLFLDMLLCPKCMRLYRAW